MSKHRIFTGLNDRRRKKPFLSGDRLILLVIITALAWILWQLFNSSDETTLVSLPEQKPVAKVVASKNIDRSQPPPLADQNQSEEDYGTQARDIITQAKQGETNLTRQEMYERAQAYAKNGKAADAYLLFFYLVKEGHGPAAMRLAEMADPEYHDPASSFYDKPDFNQAHKWYVQALMLGEEDVDKRLAQLKLRVKAAATGGDEKARRLLVGW